MSKKPDPYATEEETNALLRADRRTPAQRKLDDLLVDRGAWEQGAEPYGVLYQIAVELLAEPQGEPVNKYCCHLCFNKSGQKFLDRMILCPECGNKRCPKATHHELPCTNSNEPGQHGSIYTAPQPDKRVPLTDEQVEQAYREIWRNLPIEFGHTSAEWIEQGIKYAERAHGIGPKA